MPLEIYNFDLRTSKELYKGILQPGIDFCSVFANGDDGTSSAVVAAHPDNEQCPVVSVFKFNLHLPLSVIDSLEADNEELIELLQNGRKPNNIDGLIIEGGKYTVFHSVQGKKIITHILKYSI